MQVLSEEIVHGNHAREPKAIGFSPLDLFVMGHHTHGPIFGFERPIDPERFRRSLKFALDANPEMGVALEVDRSGVHWMRTEAGVQLILQRAPGPMPAAQRVATLPLQEFPLAHASMDAQTLIAQKLPLLGFRITQFDDGACTLGIRTTHSHLDGVSLINFLVNLGEIYNGGPAHSAQVGRDAVAGLAKGDGLVPSGGLHLVPVAEAPATDASTIECREFAHTQIIFEQDVFDNFVGKIRAEKAGIKTADIVCALAWKAWVLSALISADPELRIYSIFNLRQLKEWPLGRNFLGNAVIDRRAELDRHLLKNRSVAEIAHEFRRQTKPVKVSEVARDIAYLKRLRDQGSYGKDGAYFGIQRAFMSDMTLKRALSVNDLRFLQLHKVRFEGPALWYESGQDFPGIQGYVEVTQRANGDVVFHYHSLAEEADRFEWELRRLVSSVYVYS
jgi:hypothetical protein